jgi:hypothetical protein
MKIVDKLNESLDNFSLNDKRLSKNQLYIFILFVAFTLVLKFLLIPYNMIDHGEAATRTWNALWWAQNPFFVEPISGNPGWFYFIGPLIMITGEIFYTPIITMILAVTLAGIYIFNITHLLTGFKTALLAFIIFSFNPAIFRLNYQPIPQQLSIAAISIMIYYFLLAMGNKDQNLCRKYFTISGIFSFISIFFRPEALFVALPFCFLAVLLKKKGKYNYILLSFLFQIFWIVVSYVVYASFFKTFESVREYDVATGSNITNAGLLIRMKGFFLPYYFMVVGITFILFYFFVKGIVISYKKYPLLVFLLILFPVFIPAIINGIWSTTSSIYYTNRYYYPTFYFGSILTAIALGEYLRRFRSSAVQTIIAALVIASAIPLSYIKEMVPQKYNKLFPKVIQFIVTTEYPNDVRKLISFIDEYINSFPALIFDSEGSDSSILYIPFRTKLAPPDKVLISGYNVPVEKAGLEDKITSFMNSNHKGIIMVKKENTLMNRVFNDDAWKEKNNITMKFEEETEKWKVYTYIKN